MEIIRYGARKGGVRIGCCAVDLFQGFDTPLDAAMVSPVICGDSGVQVGDLWRGPTALDIFKQGLVTGTFSESPLIDHTYFAILSDYYVTRSDVGKEWLKQLYKHGFKFLISVNNSVYDECDEECDECEVEPHPVHIFYLPRNVGRSAVKDPFTPPEAWQVLAESDESIINWAEEFHEFAEANKPFVASDEQKKWYEEVGQKEKW